MQLEGTSFVHALLIQHLSEQMEVTVLYGRWLIVFICLQLSCEGHHGQRSKDPQSTGVLLCPETGTKLGPPSTPAHCTLKVRGEHTCVTICAIIRGNILLSPIDTILRQRET